MTIWRGEEMIIPARRTGGSWPVGSYIDLHNKIMRFGIDLAVDERKIPYKEGPLDERDVDLLLIKMVGADNEMVRTVLDDPALRKAAVVLASRKPGDGPPGARESILAQVQRAASNLVDNLRAQANAEREAVRMQEKVLLVRQQIDSLLTGVDKIAA